MSDDTNQLDANLLAGSRLLRDEARRLLQADRLLATVRSAGPAEVIGSYALDLMTWPDIDISLQLPDERDVSLFFELGAAVIARFEVAKMSYSNHFIRRDQGFTHGLYWGMRLLYGGQEWKVDLWGYGPEAFTGHMAEFAALRQRLAGADRLAILRVKSDVCRRREYRDTITSMDVYDAVCHGITTVEGFDRWLASRR